MSDSNLNLTDKFCVRCSKKVVDALEVCKICNAPYHSSCASRTSLLESGAFSRCCGPPRAKSPVTVTLDVPPTTSQANAVVTVSDIERIINNAMTGLNKRLDIMSESISDIKSDIGNLTLNVHDIVDDLGILRNTVGDTVQRVDDLTERITNIEGSPETETFENCAVKLHCSKVTTSEVHVSKEG
ncbi:uncharacterized protein LOC127279350 [Leptopilina boulardi]|uniref:uncharacterized protein LOC127279350 n=1 Tax=Leptopilina boulardi TaxID=63433 RepID=UPI0021F5A665|nr:uncharacterized protein LOC127279350 [Leptopilina boulardi]